MKPTHVLGLALAFFVGAAASVTGAAEPASKPSLDPSGRELSVLPDTAVLAIVGPRVIRGIDMRERFYAADAQTRPRADSIGYRQFLDIMVDKEVLGMTAREINPPFGFEDRADMRRHTNTVLQNILYTRMVIDSIEITEKDFESVYPPYERVLNLRSMLFSDRATAEKVRLDLLRGRIAWREAVRRFSRSPELGPEGTMGWVKRPSLRGEYGLSIFALETGSISPVLQDAEGFRLLQCLGVKKVPRPPLSFMRPLILEDLRSARRAPLVERMYREVRKHAKVEYDTANIVWAAQHFKAAYNEIPPGQPGQIDMTSIIPDFSPADTGRVLLRTPTHQVTLNQFLYEFSSIPVLFRQRLVSLEPFIFAIDGPALTEERIDYARKIGLEKDPEAVQLIERRREELMLEHVYQDSVTNRIVVTPDMRRAFYKANEKGFYTFAKVRYAQFVRRDSLAAVELMARFSAGEHPENVLRADSIRGDDSTSAVHEQMENEPSEFKRVLFEELKPGQWTRFGPDKFGKHMVFYVIQHDASRKLAFEEVQTIVDESVQNLEAERLLKEFVQRHRARYAITTYPEKLNGRRLSDPKFDLDAGRTALKQ